MKRGVKKLIINEDPKNIKLLGASSFFNDVSSNMVTSILPYYITALGGGGIAVGLVSGLREGLASLLKIIGGWLSDRMGKRKRFVFFGYLLSTLSRILFVLASSWQQLIAIVSFERLGKLRDAPRDAIIHDSTKEHGKGFGIQGAMDVSGSVIATIAVIFLFGKFHLGFKPIIVIACILGIFSLLPLIFVQEPKTQKFKKGLFAGIKLLPKKLKYFIFVTAVFSFGNFGLYLFLILRLQAITGSMITPLIFYALFSLVQAASSIPSGQISDRIGRKRVLIFGYILFLVIAFGLIFASDLASIAILFTFYGMVYGITETCQRAYVADHSQKEEGTGLGFYHSVVGIVTIPGGIIAGTLWNISHSAMFAYTSVIAFISLMLLFFAKDGERKNTKTYKI
jgi:MFS family permease